MAGRVSTAEQKLTKTKMCKFMERGECLKGKQCPFAHCVSELQARPNLHKTSLCLAFQRSGTCRDGAACKYAHGEHDLGSGEAFKAEAECDDTSSNLQRVVMEEQSAQLDRIVPMSPQLSNSVCMMVPMVPVIATPCGGYTPGDQQEENAMLGSNFKVDKLKVVGEDAWDQETDVGDDDLESFGIVSRQTTVENEEGEDETQNIPTSYSLVDSRVSECSDSCWDADSKSGSTAALEKLHRAPFEKTKLCKFFLRGECAKGARCKYAHGDQLLQPRPNLSRTRLCVAFKKDGKCKLGDTCNYAHGAEQLRESACLEKKTVQPADDAFAFEMSFSNFDDDAKVIDSFTQVPAQSCSWTRHSATGIGFCLDKTFLKFRQGAIDTPHRSASCER